MSRHPQARASVRITSTQCAACCSPAGVQRSATNLRDKGSYPVAAVCVVLLIAALALFPSCGGGGAVVAPPPPPPPPPPAPPPSITTTSLPDGVAGSFLTVSLTASGGQPPYVWSLASGSSPPDGTIFLDSGQFWGTLSFPGTFNFTVQVRDLAGSTATRALTMRVNRPLQAFPSNLPWVSPGESYNEMIVATGGIAPYSFSVSGDPLPPGMTFQSNGTITGMVPGTAPTGTSHSLSVQVTDSSAPPQNTSVSYVIRVESSLNSGYTGEQNGQIGEPLSGRVWASGGTPPITFSIASGGLPTGLSLDATTGQIFGTPTEAGTFSLYVDARDSSIPFRIATAPVTLNVAGPISISTTSLLDGVLGQPVFDNVSVIGGLVPIGLRVTSGSVPPGTILRGSGVLTRNFQLDGWPSAAGSFTFTVEASDSNSPPGVATQVLTKRVNTQLWLNSSPLIPDALEDAFYSFLLSASGGVQPYTWLPTSSGLPAGLVLNSNTGQLTGTPTTAAVGTSTFTVVTLDSGNPPQQLHSNITMRIVGRLGIGTSSLPAVQVGQNVRLVLSPSGGVAPYSWNLQSGSLPSGLTLSPAGAITGTPTSTGTQTFTLQVADPSSPFPQTAQRTLSLDVLASLGRNDSIQTATPLSNGRYAASISPFADPVGDPPEPDVDFYAVTAQAGSLVQIEIFADRLSPASIMDSVLEIQDGSGNQHASCSPYTDIVYTRPCLNDDYPNGLSLDSILFFRIPGTPGTPVTFYVRVLDWSGDARPDFRYEISITGAN